MDLRDLRYFETIAQLEHLGKASTQLHRTQPALTSSIRRLEAACGAPLFEKSGRGIKLSAAGHVLLKWAQRLRFDLDDARREMAALAQGLGGHIRIGVVPTAAQFLLPPAVRALMTQAPQVTLKTVVALADVLRAQLRQGELDVIIGTESTDEEGFSSQVLAEDAVVVVASAQHRIFEQPPKSLRDLCAYGWVLQPSGAPTRDWLDHAFARQHLPAPRVQIESSMLLLMPALIAQTGLLSFVSRYHPGHSDSHAQLREVPLKASTMRRRLVVTHRSNSYLPPAAQLLIQLLIESAGS